MRLLIFLLFTAAILALASLSSAQIPTGTLSGQVISDGAPLPLVVVTASSPVLQRERRVLTSDSGHYILPFLPPGEYRLSFELDGVSQSPVISNARWGDPWWSIFLEKRRGLCLESLAEPRSCHLGFFDDHP